MNKNRLPKIILKCIPQGHRGTGRPKTREEKRKEYLKK
jgi:hypothetical protein